MDKARKRIGEYCLLNADQDQGSGCNAQQRKIGSLRLATAGSDLIGERS